MNYGNSKVTEQSKQLVHNVLVCWRNLQRNYVKQVSPSGYQEKQDLDAFFKD